MDAMLHTYGRKMFWLYRSSTREPIENGHIQWNSGWFFASQKVKYPWPVFSNILSKGSVQGQPLVQRLKQVTAMCQRRPEAVSLRSYHSTKNHMWHHPGMTWYKRGKYQILFRPQCGSGAISRFRVPANLTLPSSNIVSRGHYSGYSR